MNAEARTLLDERTRQQVEREASMAVVCARPRSVTIDGSPTTGTIRERITDVDQRVVLDWVPLHFGGARPWFICPSCR